MKKPTAASVKRLSASIKVQGPSLASPTACTPICVYNYLSRQALPKCGQKDTQMMQKDLNFLDPISGLNIQAPRQNGLAEFFEALRDDLDFRFIIYTAF